jgi:hypothetical protein
VNPSWAVIKFTDATGPRSGLNVLLEPANQLIGILKKP